MANGGSGFLVPGSTAAYDPLVRTRNVVLMLACAVAALGWTGFRLSAARAQSTSSEGRVIHYFITDGDADTGFRVSDRELARWAFEAWARNSDGAFSVAPASLQEEALIRVYWVPADGSR